jgi:hypothetical protein
MVEEAMAIVVDMAGSSHLLKAVQKCAVRIADAAGTRVLRFNFRI